MEHKRILPPLWLLFGLMVVAGLRLALPVLPVPLGLRGCGLPLLLGGVVLTVAAERRFRGAGTPVCPFAEPTSLVTTGPFRWSRNPMYLGMVLLLLGSAWGLGSPPGLLVAPAFAAIVQRSFIRKEEQALRDRFGDTYRRYAAGVRRWI